MERFSNVVYNRNSNSPSPIRKHGSLLDLFNATNNDASRQLLIMNGSSEY